MISNNAPKSDVDEYNLSRSYKKGDEVRYQNDIYKATKDTRA